MIEKLAEQFTLILRHELVSPDGERIELDRPIVTKYSHIYNDGTPHAIIINRMLKDLGEYTIRAYSEEIDDDC